MKKTIITGIILTVTTLAMLAGAFRHSEPLESKPLGAISGRVTDAAAGSPLVSVAVQVVGTTMGSLTDPEGKYTIKNIIPGSYTLKVSLVGYAVQEISALTVSAGVTTQQDFQLVSVAVAVDKAQIVFSERQLPTTAIQKMPVAAAQEVL